MKTEYNSQYQMWLEIRGVLLGEENNRPEQVALPSDYDDFDAWLNQRKQVADYFLHKLEKNSEPLPMLRELSEDIGSGIQTQKFLGEKTSRSKEDCTARMLDCLRLLQKIHERTRFHMTEDAVEIQKNLAYQLVLFGEFLLKTQWNDLSESAFLRAHKMGDCFAGTYLVEGVLQGKIGSAQEYPADRLMELLWPGVCEELSDSLVLMALVLALEMGTPEDWQLGDELMARVCSEQTGMNEIVRDLLLQRWDDWADENEDDPYPKLALAWLRRHGIAHESKWTEFDILDILSAPKEERLPYAPSWIYERA